MTDHDDAELRDRLRALDPAASLRPLPDERVTGLLEATTSDDRDLDLPEIRATGVHDRSRLTWLVAAAALVLIAGVVGYVLVDRGDDDVTNADPATSGTADGGSPSAPSAATSGPPDGSTASGSDPAVTVLSAPATTQGRCAVPTAEVLARQSVAFDGTVDAIDDDGRVTLTPTVFYAGEPTEQVRVEAPPERMPELVLAVELEVGERYLISGSDGQVSICGYSGPWSPELEQLYLEAFPG